MCIRDRSRACRRPCKVPARRREAVSPARKRQVAYQSAPSCGYLTHAARSLARTRNNGCRPRRAVLRRVPNDRWPSTQYVCQHFLSSRSGSRRYYLRKVQLTASDAGVAKQEADMKRRIGQYKARVTLFSAVAVVVFTMLMGVAFAADSTTSATLNGGSLNISSALTAGTFAGTLEGAAQTLTGTDFTGFSINDARGTGVGWDVTMMATPFVNATVAGKDLTANSFTAPLFGVAKADTGSSAVPGTLHVAATIDTGIAGVVICLL